MESSETTERPVLPVRVPDDLIAPGVSLVGVDGNAFAIMGVTRRGLRRAGNSDAVIDSYIEQAMAGDYDHLLRVSIAFCGMPYGE